MGNNVGRDALAAVSPWSTQVTIVNQCQTPVLVFLARDPGNPRPEDAYQFEAPPNDDYPISSGWLKEPRATLLIRTAVDEAKVIRAANAARLVVSVKPHGLHVESPDNIDVVIEDFEDAAAVPGHDTVPMVMRGESFGAPSHPAAREQQEHLAMQEGGGAREVARAAPQAPQEPPPSLPMDTEPKAQEAAEPQAQQDNQV